MGRFNQNADEFHRWSELEIARHDSKSPVRFIRPKHDNPCPAIYGWWCHECYRFNRAEQAFTELLETDMKLRHSIEDALIEAARERELAMREAG
jgi:hypothetical protein